MAKSKYFIFRNVCFKFSLSDEEPRYWYSVNKKSEFKEIRYFSIEKHTKQDMVAYWFALGPFCMAVAWLKKRNIYNELLEGIESMKEKRSSK